MVESTVHVVVQNGTRPFEMLFLNPPVYHKLKAVMSHNWSVSRHLSTVYLSRVQLQPDRTKCVALATDE